MSKRRMTSIALAAAVAISTVQLAYPANVFANENNIVNVKSEEVNNNNIKEITLNESSLPKESIVISKDTIWSEDKELSGELVVKEGVTLTIKNQVSVKGDLNISGGGTIKSDSLINGATISSTQYNNMFIVYDKATLTLENITIDGGAKWGNDASDEHYEVLGYSLDNTGIKREGGRAAMVQVLSGGTINIKNKAILQNNDASTTAGSAVRSDNATINIYEGAIVRNNVSNSGAIATIRGSLNMYGGYIKNNAAIKKESLGGGGLRIQSNANINGGTISNNWCITNGGGISATYTETGEIINIKNLKVNNNYAKVCAGGMNFNVCTGKNLIEDSYIISNEAGKSESGLLNQASNIEMNNVKVKENKALYAAGVGGIGTLTLKDCEISKNESYASSGIYYPHLNTKVIFKGNNLISNNIILEDTKNELVYDIYKHNNKNSQVVLDSTEGVILSDALTGGKIDGIDFYSDSKKPSNTLGENIVNGDNYSIKESDIEKLSFVDRFYKENDKEYMIVAENGIGKRVEAKSVTLYPNYDSKEELIKRFRKDSDVEFELPSMFRKGYIFKGWSKSETGGEIIKGEKITVSESIKLYAQWEESKYNPIDKIEIETTEGESTSKEIVVKNENDDKNFEIIDCSLDDNENFEVKIKEDDPTKIIVTPKIGLKEGDYKATLIITLKDGSTHDIELFVKIKKESNTGGGSVTPSVPSTPSKPSKPVYTHTEISGADRYETAAKVADELGSYDNVVLVNATSTMSDGLSASGLAGKENGAILLTKKDSIPKVTMDRIRKVKRVYIIGGEAAISQKVADQITATGVKVERIGGKDRVETSKLVAEKLGNYSDAFIVNGFKGEADAMSASSVAARYGAPILLTNGKTSTHAKKSGVEYYVVGGSNVVNKSIAKKYDAEVLAGKDRYATNREVIAEFYSGSDKLYIANGETLVDALTASTIAKNHGIVLVNKKSDNSVLKDKNTVQIGGMNFDIDFE